MRVLPDCEGADSAPRRRVWAVAQHRQMLRKYDNVRRQTSNSRLVRKTHRTTDGVAEFLRFAILSV